MSTSSKYSSSFAMGTGAYFAWGLAERKENVTSGWTSPMGWVFPPFLLHDKELFS